jgi:pimeloyl-ACP methyl ester carboxylesterase
MNKKVGILFIHGMGSTMDDFAHDTIQEIRNRLSGMGLNRDDVAWESVFWAPVLSPRESQLWVDLSAENDLNWAKLRKFFINGFGNITAYQAVQDRRNDVYGRIHQLVLDALKELRVKLGGADKPLIVVAHSLGSVIMSNYIWDRQKGRDTGHFGATPFERMETLAGMITLGTNIPLFTLGCDKVACIDFPPAMLPDNLKRKAKWLNFYDSDDVLGWPLKPLSICYADTVHEDIEVSVGNILTAWNPANHAAYWTDDSVIKPTSYLIAKVLEECQGQAVAAG